MPEQRSHGLPRYQEPRHDELPEGKAVAEQADAGHERKANGTIAKGAKTTPTKGGKARKGRTRLTHHVAPMPVSDTLKKRASYMRKRTCSELARVVGGGECGIVASVMVKLASEDLALRETALASGDVEAARKFGETARQHLLYAREVASKDAKARNEATGPIDPLAKWRDS